MNSGPHIPRDFKQFFEREGYVVIPNAVPQALCEQAKQAFIQDIKADNRFFMRHESSSFERHKFTEAGFMKYPIMNIQDLSSRKLSNFRRLGLEILTYTKLREVMKTLLGTNGKIIHTMYFDGNQQTWAHRDCDYIDSEQTGHMIGVLVAVEDIHPGAGRFFVIENSHRIQFPLEWHIGEIDPNGREYKDKLAEFVALRTSESKCIAPVLKQGDAIMWSSLTVHGSLATTAPSYSRRSFTAHYISKDQQHIFKYGQHAIRPVLINGVEIIHRGNQMRFSTQLKHFLKNDHPALYRAYPYLHNAYKSIVKIKRDVDQRYPYLHRFFTKSYKVSKGLPK